MNRIELLQLINLGNSVAEFDKNLEDYFITTPSVQEVLLDRWDIIRGTKGSGKSAILLSLIKRHKTIPELEAVELIPATCVYRLIRTAIPKASGL